MLHVDKVEARSAAVGAGMLGVVAMTGLVLPELLDTIPEMLGEQPEPLPVPMWVLVLASVAQSSLLLALAVWGGVALSPAVGLRAPAFEAAAARQPVMSALRPQLAAGIVAGILGGAFLVAFARMARAGRGNCARRAGRSGE